MTQALAPAKTNGNGGGDKKGQPVAFRPFVAGTREINKATYDPGARTLNASTQDLPLWQLEPIGFSRSFQIVVECTTAGNSAAVTFHADGPFNVLDSVTFFDTNSQPIIGPMGGHDLYIAIKYGGYNYIDDAKEGPEYSATTGAGATGGSFSFVLHVPLEIGRRDGLGALPNKSASATYDVQIRLAANATVYGVVPTAAGSVRVRTQHHGWMDPNGTDIQGRAVAQNPPGVQTTQYIIKQNQDINAGSFARMLQGLDSYVRGIYFELRDSTGSRTQGDADWPDPFNMVYETAQPLNLIRKAWRQLIVERWGYKGTVETANGRDYGVYPWSYAYDMGTKVGNETRYGYLPVSSATTLQINGTIGGSGSHTLNTFVNQVVPSNGDGMVLTGR